MNQSTIFDLTLGPTLASQEKHRKLAANGAIAATGSLLLFLASRMSVEIGPVPVTMQSLAVILMALVLGPKRAMAAASLYFIECWAIPGFSARPMILTGGYVLGFIAAAAVAGHLYRLGHGRTWAKALFASAAANLVIFAVGLPWLALSLGLTHAWEFGGKPFVVAELVKIVAGVVLLRSLTAAARSLNSGRI